STQWQEFNILIGKYFSLVFRMFQKENIILFPVASSSVSKDAWQTMHIQSFEYPFPFIDSPQKPSSNAVPQAAEQPLGAISNTFVSETGNLSTEQALLIFNNLPVDITVVDENDKVLFFNKAKERFFPRSPAIVGRSVQNCHPPESVHVVEKIIAAFRSGEKDKADFWIQMRGRFILIQYFALRNPKGEYKGVLEVSQDATETRGLQGEKRLLSWE
ncbi:MAG TPA: PAS domain-containing protein, partial [Tenuifilaceae bacterium]|nr:PAS domain-containing protein [Tenuifilaceae bacterium]